MILHDELESCLTALPSDEARADFQWCVDPGRVGHFSQPRPRNARTDRGGRSPPLHRREATFLGRTLSGRALPCAAVPNAGLPEDFLSQELTPPTHCNGGGRGEQAETPLGSYTSGLQPRRTLAECRRNHGGRGTDWVVRLFRFSPNHRIMLPIIAWPSRPGEVVKKWGLAPSQPTQITRN